MSQVNIVEDFELAFGEGGKIEEFIEEEPIIIQNKV